MDMKIGNSIFLNKAPPQKLVLAPNAIIRGNMALVFWTKAISCGSLHCFETNGNQWDTDL